MSSNLDPINQLQEIQENIDQIIRDFRADYAAAGTRITHLESVAAYYQPKDSKASWLRYMEKQAEIAESLNIQATDNLNKLKNYIVKKSREWEESNA